MANNPLFPSHNEVFNFSSLIPEHIDEATKTLIATAQQELSDLYTRKEATFANSMETLDQIGNRMDKTGSVIFLMAYVHPDAEVRQKAQAAISEISRFENGLSLDENLYQAVKKYSLTPEAKQLSGYKKRFVEKTVEDFERNGLALPLPEREALKKLKDELSDLGIQFTSNISDYKDQLIVTEEEIEGLPQDYKDSRRNEDGTYTIDLSYPSYNPFMKFSGSDTARKKLYVKFNNRAADTNLATLDKMILLRGQIAKALGYETYAHYRTSDRMVKNPATVWSFEESLKSSVKPKAIRDYEELLEVKRRLTGNSKETTIYPWEAGYYTQYLLREKYSVDEAVVKEYFELNKVLDGLFAVHARLFGITFSEVEAPSVWHPEVRMFEVQREGRLAGRFYLDLFPRDNKYNHAAKFSMLPHCHTPEGAQVPAATLVCNFPKATQTRPSLLNHREVETMFHEFGHLMHELLSVSPLASYAGTRVARDFVEVPSQLAENWTWEYESLALFAKHYQTGETLPVDLHARMVAAKNVGSGLHTLQQVFYGTYDFTLHDGFVPGNGETTTDVLRRLQNEITLYPHTEGTHFQAAFGHLNGYAAGYYGYLWSLVYADDIFSVFKKEGVFNAETGKRYLEKVLSQGSTKDEYGMLVDFLGREPNQDAFLKAMGL